MDVTIARERLASVVKPDSITYSQGDFLATHVAVQRLRLVNKFDVAPSEGREYSEEEVYRKFILNKENKHQFIAVYGQSGTGKSHLIRWFEAKYRHNKPAQEVVLFIRRSDNTLKGTIRQLLDMPEVQEIANKDAYDRLLKAAAYEDENKLKGRLYHEVLNEVEHDEEDRSIHLKNIERKRLIAFLNNEVVRVRLEAADGPIERIYSKIAENSLVDRDTIAQFTAEDFFISAELSDQIERAGVDPKAMKMVRALMADEDGREEAEKVAAYLNQFVNDVVQRCAGIAAGDFRDIFRDIRRELFRLGKSLTLFIEDVTSFTGVDDALLDALIVEHTGMNEGEKLCRISSIIGTTGNYLQHNFRDNHKDRITQYVYIPSDAFDEAGLFEFVGRYLNAMSVPESRIADWLENAAEPADYPVHTVKEGKNWEFVPIEFDKKLCLYPFTKNSIRYLYQHALKQNQQTPRYIIRDMIEPVVNDILNGREKFPSLPWSLVRTNTTLSYRIESQIRDEQEAARVLRFLSIWGDGTPDQFTKDGVVYQAGVRSDILEELAMPPLRLSEVEAPKTAAALAASGAAADHASAAEKSPAASLAETPVEPPVVSAGRVEKVERAVAVLSKWVEGQAIDVSSTGGTSGALRAARDDIAKYLLSAIPWQAEGISLDQMGKIQDSSAPLVDFENQTRERTQGLYTMPASRESMHIIAAFLRWREYGGQSWAYPESDLDAYFITLWTSRIKSALLKAVRENADAGVGYIEAAISAEIYRQILCGEFREKSLKNLTVRHLFEKKEKKAAADSHVREWSALCALLSQKGADEVNRKTVRQYFNIAQGDGGSVIVLDEPNLARTLRKVKSNRLSVPESAFEMQDPVKRRRDVFDHLKKIVERVGKVADAEQEKARSMMKKIRAFWGADEFDDGEAMEEEDLLMLAERVKAFYDEANRTQFSVAFFSTDPVKKGAKQIAKALSDVGGALEEKDPLAVLLAFSGDPLTDLKPLLDLFERLEADFKKIDAEMAKRQAALGEEISAKGSADRYEEELQKIEKGRSYFTKEAQA